MQLTITRNRFLKDNIYLLLTSLLLLSISVFTGRTQTAASLGKSYAASLSKYIANAEENFEELTKSEKLLNEIISPEHNVENEKIIDTHNQFIFVYETVEGFTQLTYWNTQTILPDASIIQSKRNIEFKKLANGYYFIQKKNIKNNLIVSLLPVKWKYSIASNYLKNTFAVSPLNGEDFEISYNKNNAAVVSKNSSFLFSVKNLHPTNKSNNRLTIWLRILSVIPLFIFLHFLAIKMYEEKGFKIAVVFFAGTLLLFRFLIYYFPVLLQLRSFELFDPSIYGSDIILRSLGDLLINSILFFWIISFIKNRLDNIEFHNKRFSDVQQWLFLLACVLVVLFVTYTAGSIIRSLVADSQIPFDVLNFFSLNVYSVTGFLVLCSMAIGYYHFCKVVFYLLRSVFPNFAIPFFLLLSVLGLFLLSFKIGSITNGFELYELLWLLLFLFLVKNDLSGFFAGPVIISRLVFWLFFFSASIASIIIIENSRKELRNRQRYAETLAAKTNHINEVLLNTMLTDFRPDLIANKFYLFENEKTAAILRDSLINNNNVSSFTNKYSTKILVYDSLENPLFNDDPILYTSIVGLYTSQAKSTQIAGLNYYYSGYDQINYVAKKIVRDYNGILLGYVFVIIQPQATSIQNLAPELFNAGQNNSLETSIEYAYAIYEKGKLISSHNDFAFSSRYQEKYFAGKEFLLDTKNNYSELWYNAGANKYVVIVKENRILIELITLFSYLFCAFLLLSALSWIISLLVRSRLDLNALKKTIQLSIKQQVHGTIIFFSVFSFFIIGIATILYFINRYENNNKETLSRIIKIMEEELTAQVSSKNIRENTFKSDVASSLGSTENVVNNLSKIHGLNINLYSLSGNLQASSFPIPYIKGIVSTKMDPTAFFHLNEGKEIQYFQKEQIGTLNYVSGYIPVTDSTGNDIAYLNIPYFISQTKLKEEISNFLITIINLNAFIFLIAGIVALIITNRITNSFSFISEKMKMINLGKRNESLIWERNDEIGALVKEYNKMLLKLDESAMALAKSERESAWQEMAKQVAHEIKNPLTPMKLSMQFLQRSIENDAPNIKELGARVSATLVEQIDHLSQIAAEFSRFATIEKATPEKFNLNEALQSVKQLYAADQITKFTWKLPLESVLVYADKTHINRILTNLILNGIQAVQENTIPHITIEETILTNMVQIEIADNGTGISNEMKPKIFMPNFTTKSSGTGLGLAMCKRMAEQAGGDLHYETSTEGTSFFISLPIVI